MEPLLQVEHISKRFPLGGGRSVAALTDVSLTVYRGETLGIVGESGCGKSTLARVVMGVYPPTEGRVLYRGRPLDLRRRAARLEFARGVQMVFQDPYASLDPRMTVEAIVRENLELHGLPTGRDRVCELLELVGLSREHMGRYPHEFSGGQRQRVGIARALAAQPELLVCDEPVSALDLSMQSQIVNLLSDLRRELGLTCVFIAHDLSMVRYLSDRVAVLYLGGVAELGGAEEVCGQPLHPYTRMLLDAALLPEPNHSRLEEAQASGEALPRRTGAPGCLFAERCPLAQERCHAERPSLAEVCPGRFAACHFSTGHKFGAMCE